MSALNAAACVAKAPVAKGALIATADPLVARRLPLEIERLGQRAPSIASTFAHLRQRLVREAPGVLVIDDSLLRNAPLAAALHQFESAGPVILLARLNRQREAAVLVAEGKIEFVVREGDFPALAAGLIERRLRAAALAPPPIPGPTFGEWRDIGEVFRHEINNPLTGILGNSEMLLAHREHLTPADTQRLETIVDLAVRLRETIRRLSASLESSGHVLKAV